jgi:uncharacterized protein (DUF2336 family)
MRDLSNLPADYEEAKATAHHGPLAARIQLAARTDLPPELLYFLAEDEHEAVRAAAATNPRLPQKADRFLAEDKAPEVRQALAGRLAEQPGPALAGASLEMLARLAKDQMPRVRAVIAEVLKARLDAPQDLIAALARDVELLVSQPVLEFSPLLSDGDLIDIIHSGVAEGALTAIARRQFLVGEVTDALVETGNVAAIGQLLRNNRAQIREDTIDRLIDRAPKEPTWQEALVDRQGLSKRATLRLATVIADHLLDRLTKRHAVDPDMARDLRDVVQRRLEDGQMTPFAQSGDEPLELQDRLTHLRTLQAAGELDDPSILAAIASQDRGFVLCAMSVLTGLPLSKVIEVLRSHNAKAVCALVWKAGLGAGVAAEIQQRVAKIPASDILYPTTAGAFPMSAAAMEWQLELFIEN